MTAKLQACYGGPKWEPLVLSPETTQVPQDHAGTPRPRRYPETTQVPRDHTGTSVTTALQETVEES